MTFVELREEAQDLVEVWGYANSPRPPDWYKLINEAYKDFCFATDAIKGPEITFNTTADQAEYNLKTIDEDDVRDWKTFLDVLYDGQRVTAVDEAVVRRDNPTWLTVDSGTPTVRWSPRPNYLRFLPAPNAVVEVTVYGIRAPFALANDTDEPVIQDSYHPAIPLRAAWKYAKRYAKSEEQFASLQLRNDEYQDLVDAFKGDQGESGNDGSRVVAPVVPDRVYL